MDILNGESGPPPACLPLLLLPCHSLFFCLPRLPAASTTAIPSSCADINTRPLPPHTAAHTPPDLLTFEKLDSGILDLHRQDVPALQFLAETVNIFSAQAKQHEVGLDLVLGPEDVPRGRGAGALPLLFSDTCSIDRFKVRWLACLEVRRCPSTGLHPGTPTPPTRAPSTASSSSRCCRHSIPTPSSPLDPLPGPLPHAYTSLWASPSPIF